ncbi:hypothetical protein PV328_002219 [Microctonus aethiopoides]|uniref:MutS-like protein n=1 Tax=Microctonus aethiopoides TaxID=144406 RepID=A0AA39FZW9_9HYME|nr:hypothetical protein PV328_002219 [Microctonus aethiopoides]
METNSAHGKNKPNPVDVTQLRLSIDTLLASSDEEENNKNNHLHVADLHMSFESLLASSDEDWGIAVPDLSSTGESIMSKNNQDLSTDPSSLIQMLIKKEENEVIQSQMPLDKINNNFPKQNKDQSTQQTQPILRDHSSNDDLFNEENILSLSWAKGQLGAAYYNMNTSELFVMDDVFEDEFSYNITKTLYKQCQPHFVLLTNGTSVSFVSVITKLIVKDTLDENNEETSSNPSAMAHIARTSLRLLPKNENNYENCYHRVNCLKLDCEPENSTNAERVTFLNSLLNFKSHMMIHALGILLRYLDANWNKMSLNPSGQAQFVQLNHIMLNDLVMIEEDSYRALNIMQSRFHPSSFKFGASTFKGQGTCLFTFLNRCQSRPGMQHLWKLMRHPTRNIDTLKERFRAIEFFLCPDNQNAVETLKSCLKKISRLTSSVINKYSTTQAKATDWSRFNTTISNIINIGEICTQYRDSAVIFGKIVDSISNEMHYIRYFIDHIIDLEMSKKHRKFIVKTGVDPELDELNHKRQLLPQLLTEMATRELDNLPDNVETCRMIYVPDIQYCLAITSWNGPPPSDDEEIPGLEFKFIINGMRYYKSDGARELDESLGDILLKITRRQSQIMLRLVQYVSKHIGPILHCIEYCAELDVLLSFAMVARDHNYIKPEIIKSHIIDIKVGRHPLKELMGNFVANDTLSSDDSSLVKIFTGPNACGKTIYLKQVALIIFMAHIGCYVPADSATIGIVTHILTQMPSTESITQNASSFLIDLRQVNNILYSSTPNCLIIMDEFGKGTAQFDAVALLSSILKSFVDRGRYCPHIFVATHMHRTIDLIPKTPILEAQSFEFLTDEDGSIIFLYRLISGNTKCSYAHAAAKSAGLFIDDVTESMEIFEYIKKGELPPLSPKENRSNILRHIVELTSQKKNEDVNLDDLRQWVRQILNRKG